MSDATIIELQHPDRSEPTQADLRAAADELRFVADRIEAGESGSYALAYENRHDETFTLTFGKLPGTKSGFMIGMGYALVDHLNRQMVDRPDPPTNEAG